MTKKSRYLLLATGFVVFLILAPIIVLYVRGISYNFSTKSFVKTGILAVSIEPPNAEVFLGGQKKRDSQGNISFLTPGEYQVQIQKAGYQPWGKRLMITAGQVTWASPPYNSIDLFLSAPVQKTFASSVVDFYSQGNSVAWIGNNSFNLASVNGAGSAKNYPLPKAVNKIVTVDNSGNDFVLENTSSTAPTILVFNSPSGQFTDISALFPAPPKMQFAGDGSLYALSDGVLYSVNLLQQTKEPLFSGVQGFYFLGSSLYFIQNSGQSNTLLTTEAPFLNNQILLNNLPNLGSADLFVTYGKQIFVLSGGSLYLANASMQKLADGVDEASFDSQYSSLPILQNGELDYFDTLSQATNFVTRSSQPLSNPIIRNDIGYAFFLQNNQIQAIELDTRDSQNQYVLYNGTSLEKYFIDSAGKNILLLDNGELKSLVIR